LFRDIDGAACFNLPLSSSFLYNDGFLGLLFLLEGLEPQFPDLPGIPPPRYKAEPPLATTIAAIPITTAAPTKNVPAVIPTVFIFSQVLFFL